MPDPRVCCLAPEALAASRARASAADPVTRDALRAALASAHSSRTAGPYSVTHKGHLPPSGDPHDYVSFGPYWWPDPAQPDGLPYIRRDGETNPESKDDDRSDSPRLALLVAAVESLALAFYLAGDAACGARAVELLRIWFLDPKARMNPHLEYGQAIPGRVAGRGVGIIDTARLTALVDAVGMLRGSADWTAAEQAGLEDWFARYLDWLLHSAHGRDERAAHNNHGTWYDAQVASFALFTGQEDLARETIATARTRRVDTQIAPDGSQPHELARTKALSYSVFNLRALAALATMGEQVDVDLWGYRPGGGAGIREAIAWLAAYAAPEVPWSHAQIEPTSRALMLPLLLRAAHVYGETRFAEAVNRLPADEVRADRAWLIYPLDSPTCADGEAL